MSEKKEKEKKRQSKWYASFSSKMTAIWYGCLSWAKKQEEKATSTSRESQTRPTATTFVKQLFFFSPGFLLKATWLCMCLRP